MSCRSARWALAAVLSVGSAATATPLGEWSLPVDLGFRIVHAALIPTKDTVLLWGYAITGSTITHELDPASMIAQPSEPGLTAMFCSGNEYLSDGRLLVVGGVAQNIESGIYHPFQDAWMKISSMAQHRYYPSATTMADGRVFVTGGTGNKTNTVEVYDPTTDRWDQTHPPSPHAASGYFPRVFQLPSGKLGVIYIQGASVAPHLYDVQARQWSVSGPIVEGGPTAHYLPGKVLIAGHDLHQATVTNNITRVVDFTTDPVSVRLIGPKAFNGQFNTLTILPDGQVLSVGGRGPHGELWDTPELWNPDTERWTILAPMRVKIRHEYHSVAVLLRDGRVLLGGGEPRLTTMEVFSPPYLSGGVRPTIRSVPREVAYGSLFPLATTGPVQRVSAIRIGASTHANTWGQRFLWLEAARGPEGVWTVTAPPDGNTAPPGYYLLFAVSSAGVPSIGEYVKVGP